MISGINQSFPSFIAKVVSPLGHSEWETSIAVLMTRTTHATF